MTQTLLMYDTAGAVDSIPADAKAVAGYIDGRFRTFTPLVRRFYPHAHIVSLGVFLGHTAEFTDVEPGNPINTPELVRADFHFRKGQGVWRPGFYGDRTRMENTILPGLVGVPRSEYRLFLAEWTGVQPRRVPDGFDAVQFTNNAVNGREGAYDTTLVNVELFFPAAAQHHKRRSPYGLVQKVHPKVRAAASGGGLGTGLVALLHSTLGVSMTPAEGAAIAGAIATLLGYMVPSA